MSKVKKPKSKRKWFLSIFKPILKLIIRKPKFVFLDGNNEIEQGSIILSNHVGKKGPLTAELYLKTPFRLWGTYEMNGSLKGVYQYLSYKYYHKKHHWNLFLARVACLIIAPLTYLFYRGLNLISTYDDVRFSATLSESIKTLREKHSLVIFPEDSSKGYFDTLTHYFPGFAVLGKFCLKRGLDPLVYNAYLKKQTKTYVFDKPIRMSELFEKYGTPEEIAKQMLDRANQLKDLPLENK